jgi:hypothetical protein
MIDGDGRIDQATAQCPQARQRPLLVGSGQPAVPGDIGRQNGREFAGLRHGVRSSSAAASLLYPATSAARMAASLRVSAMAAPDA